MDPLFIILVFLVIVISLIIFSDIPELLFISGIIKTLFRASSTYEVSKKKITMQEVDKMGGDDFERWCADLLSRNGFTQVEHTGRSGDQGADIIAYKDEKKYAIQCKRYSQKLNNKAIQQVHTGKTIYGCDVAMVITNNYFTPGAIKAAKATGVLLWDRKVLEDKINRILSQNQR